jgi:uncharacterized membrane protein YphA (DoxX/SURF4 family)
VRPERLLKIAEWFLRIALAITMLSAVADRFGLWGPHGTQYAGWGDWSHFVQYCAQVNRSLPASFAGPLAVVATALEIAFSTGLISGVFLKFSAYGSAALLGLFALAMAVSFGVKSPLNYSVFVDSAGALLLAAVLEIRKSDAELTTKQNRRIS